MGGKTHPNTVSYVDISPVKIIKRADKMVEALKEHLKEQETKTEN